MNTPFASGSALRRFLRGLYCVLGRPFVGVVPPTNRQAAAILVVFAAGGFFEASWISSAFAAESNPDAFKPDIPRTWDDIAIASLELPLATPRSSPKHITADYYYRIPVRPIFKSYPVYHPDREPRGYFESLKRLDPEIVWNDKGKRPRLENEADWVAAGEVVFDAPTAFDKEDGASGPFAVSEVRNVAWYARVQVRVDRDGVLPDLRYIIRERGEIELGSISCATCHSRVLPDGSVVKGAQSNFPFERARAYSFRSGRRSEATLRSVDYDNFAVPWLADGLTKQFEGMSFDTIVAIGEVTPAGVIARIRTSPLSPVKIPDLIGVKDRRYLDHTGLVKQRSIGDLMRYSAMNQGADGLSSFDGFVPDAGDHKTLPPPEESDRYSDEQLYALALYLYSLKPPANPNLPTTTEQKALVQRGEGVFQDEGCAKCHDPKQGYTNHKLIAAPGFDVPDDHPAKDDIMRSASGGPREIGSDATLTTATRRGTGFYKVPSLLGVWYRGPFEHNGSVATLEDWFDERRLRDDYVPSGWKGPPGTKSRAVTGHEFGLDLDADDRNALIAFLRTL